MGREITNTLLKYLTRPNFIKFINRHRGRTTYNVTYPYTNVSFTTYTHHKQHLSLTNILFTTHVNVLTWRTHASMLHRNHEYHINVINICFHFLSNLNCKYHGSNTTYSKYKFFYIKIKIYFMKLFDDNVHDEKLCCAWRCVECCLNFVNLNVCAGYIKKKEYTMRKIKIINNMNVCAVCTKCLMERITACSLTALAIYQPYQNITSILLNSKYRLEYHIYVLLFNTYGRDIV
jgi:hypothetical protein